MTILRMISSGLTKRGLKVNLRLWINLSLRILAITVTQIITATLRQPFYLLSGAFVLFMLLTLSPISSPVDSSTNPTINPTHSAAIITGNSNANKFISSAALLSSQQLNPLTRDADKELLLRLSHHPAPLLPEIKPRSVRSIPLLVDWRPMIVGFSLYCLLAFFYQQLRLIPCPLTSSQKPK